MLDLTHRRGLRFPDEFLTRFFFKRGHDRKAGRVLELGCGNGCNLELYDAYGWDFIGVDISQAALADAIYNFGDRGRFQQHDLASGLPNLEGLFDVVLMPSSMYYIPRASLEMCLKQLRHLLQPKSDIYMRMRLQDDYRYGRGRESEPHGFILDTVETGEADMLNVFYSERELSALLNETIGISSDRMTLLHNSFDNLQSGRIVSNSELIIWGEHVA